ncbi:SMP-30/gluconolactonase/LRE family protein [Rhodococcus pyridinivorans]|uniref:SMP-30/gluconolactonase/LRE family protein n=2 Tax=Nocardiaceae TaxID=85025 RepID=UPI0022849D03|nr:SMP-30/gluconolactonase/LRE family protein [Rhodococcus pyridinivorans]WAL49414.1 SMP-30/gluconolactonase/LRE family protein [Rhodococcus pyridinivorans]
MENIMREHRSAVFSTGHQFLEGLRWHHGKLWASDFFSKTVKTFNADGSYTDVAEVEGSPSGLGFLDDGSVLVVSQMDRTVVRIGPDGTQSVHADFSQYAGGIGNDMIVTGKGDAYVGNFGFALGEEDPKTTRLVHVSADGSINPVGGEVLFPNGMAITPDRVLLTAQTWRHCITAFDIQEDGSLANERIWAQLDDSVHPDGIALDADGGVWFGNALTLESDSGFYRVVEGGEITDRVAIDGAWSVTCAFGGDDLRTLYMACNVTTLEEFHDGKSTSVVATANVGYKGSPAM